MKRLIEILKTLCYNLFGKNAWGWFHLVASALLTSILWRFLPHTHTTIRVGLSLVLILAVSWEIFEYYYEIKSKKLKVIDVYGTKKHYIEDTIGDVLFALIGFGIGVI